MFGDALPPKPSIRAKGGNFWTPPPGYAAPLPAGVQQPTPESKTGLYIGLGLAALVVAGGVYFLFVER